jgi:hypothetical protein
MLDTICIHHENRIPLVTVFASPNPDLVEYPSGKIEREMIHSISYKTLQGVESRWSVSDPKLQAMKTIFAEHPALRRGRRPR